MRIFLIVHNDKVIHATRDQDKIFDVMHEFTRSVIGDGKGHVSYIKDIEADMGNSELIAETYNKYAHHQLGVKDPYLVKVLFALIGLPEQCPACRCYALIKTFDGQWCCDNCKRTMIHCLEEGLIK